MKIAVIIINLVLTYIFTGGFLPEIGPIVGIVYIVISAFGIYYLRDKEAGLKFVNRHLVPIDDGMHDIEEQEILISAAFLSLGMKIGTALGLAVTFSLVAMLAFCILVASGFLIEGRKSGMTISGAWSIAKGIIWIYNKLNGIYEFIAQQIVKLEFSILKVDMKKKK